MLGLLALRWVPLARRELLDGGRRVVPPLPDVPLRLEPLRDGEVRALDEGARRVVLEPDFRVDPPEPPDPPEPAELVARRRAVVDLASPLTCWAEDLADFVTRLAEVLASSLTSRASSRACSLRSSVEVVSSLLTSVTTETA